jgi:hypothetical protein
MKTLGLHNNNRPNKSFCSRFSGLLSILSTIEGIWRSYGNAENGINLYGSGATRNNKS